jgi:nucleoside-diphosphate-sugar epimerase
LPNISNQIDVLIEELQDSSILLLGASGFIGLSILRFLKKLKQTNKFSLKVYCVSRDLARVRTLEPEWFLDDWVEWIQFDLKEEPSLRFHVDVCINAAADYSSTSQICEQEFKDMLLSVKQSLHLSSLMGVRRYLFVSSGAVYLPKNEPVTEDSELIGRASKTYGLSKLLSEELVLLESKFSCSIARVFTCSGLKILRSSKFALSSFINSALSGEEIVISGSGLDIRSYIDERDLAFFLLFLAVFGNDKMIINVGSEESISIIELARLVVEVINPKCRISKSSGSNSQSYYVPSMRKASELYNLTCRYNIKDSLELVKSELIQ